MANSSKWYQRNGLLLFFILFIYPVGLVGIWLRDTHIVKKMFFSFVGFFAAFFTTVIVLVIVSSFMPTDHYAYGQDAYGVGNYQRALTEFQRVDPDDKKYVEAQAMITKTKQKIEEEKKRKAAISTTANREVESNVAGIVNGKEPYTVLLHDMTFDQAGTDTTFSHKYKLILEDSTGMPYDTLTNWMAVSDTTFDYYSSDMGMELISENSGQVNKNSSPPGYNRYVGNTTYGRWENDSNGDSFWRFYGQYAFLTNIFGHSRPIYQYSYHDYNDYYRGRTSYYGTPTSNGYQFGTGSVNSHMQNPRSFNQRVQSRVSRSSSRFTSQSTFQSNVNNSVTRSSSRISRSSSRSSSVRGGSSSSRGGK